MSLLNEDRILEFLDGRLSGGDEEELLHTLAVSPERRQMLKEHLKVRELTTTLSKQERFSVPETVTNDLFMKLTAMGFSAPISTAEILNHAPQLVKAAREEEEIAAVVGTQYFGFLRPSAFVTACLVSFFLGIGAFYVFGSSLGIRSISQQHADDLKLRHYAAKSVQTIELPPAFDISGAADASAADAGAASESSLGSVSKVGQTSAPEAPRSNVVVQSANMIPTAVAVEGPNQPTVLKEVASREYAPLNGATRKDDAVTEKEPALTSPPINHNIPLSSIGKAHFYLTEPYRDELHPLIDEKGIISVRFGSGRAPGNTTAQWTSLSEIKFTWTVLDYMVVRASLGQLMSPEKVAKAVRLSPDSWQIIAGQGPGQTQAVAGAEIGLTLAPLNIPMEISAGFMADGGGRLYPRGGIFGQFELFDALSVGVGIEGMLYKHDLTNDLNAAVLGYSKDYKASIAPNTKTTEIVGFVGPSIELGWHF